MTDPCVLCGQPITLPIVEVWCPDCSSYARSHDGCKPGMTPDKAENQAMVRREHKLQGLCQRRVVVLNRLPWNESKALSEQPITRPDYLKESTHVPGSALGRRGRKAGQ